MTAEKKTIKFQMMMSPREAEILDDWAFANRIKSRAEAIRRLMRAALEVDGLTDEVFDLLDEVMRREAYLQQAHSLPEEQARSLHDAVSALSGELMIRLDHISTVFKSARTERAGEDLEGSIEKSRKFGDTLRDGNKLLEKLASRPRERRTIANPLDRERAEAWLADHPEMEMDIEEAAAAAYIDSKWRKSYNERPEVAAKRSEHVESLKGKSRPTPIEEQPD